MAVTSRCMPGRPHIILPIYVAWKDRPLYLGGASDIYVILKRLNLYSNSSIPDDLTPIEPARLNDLCIYLYKRSDSRLIEAKCSMLG